MNFVFLLERGTAVLRPVMLLLALSFCLYATAATINVPADYGTIQAAVNAAGDEIIVAAGTYNESVDLGSGPEGITLTTDGAVTVNGGGNGAFRASGHTGHITITGFSLGSSMNNLGI